MARHEIPEGQVHFPVGPDVGNDGAFMLARFAERVFEQAAGIANGIARDFLRPVEMAQGRIAERRKEAARHLVRPADGQGPFRITGYAAGDEGMGDADRAHTVRDLAALPAEEGLHGLLVAADLILAEALADDGRFGIGDGQEGDLSGVIFQDDRARKALQFTGHIEALRRQEAAGKGQAGRAVVVAADDQEGDVQIRRDPRGHVVEEFHRFGRRQAAVIDVASQDDGIDALVPYHGQELLLQDVGLVFGQIIPIE